MGRAVIWDALKAVAPGTACRAPTVRKKSGPPKKAAPTGKGREAGMGTRRLPRRARVALGCENLVSRAAWESGGPARLRLGSRHDFVAVKLDPHTQPAVRSTDRLYMNYVSHTNPVACGHVGDLLWHLKVELNPGAAA